jgi:DNA-binding transcriptional LysR family regulator
MIAGSAAEAAATRKTEKYSDLPAGFIFHPIALETLGAFNSSAAEILGELGNRIRLVTGEPRETRFLFQRLSIVLQRYNSILLFQSFVADYDPDL